MTDDFIAGLRNWQLRLLAFVVVAFCVYCKFITGGWFMFIGLFFYPLFAHQHFFCHSNALPKSGPISRPLLKLMLLSHAFFIVCFMVQYDGGDSSSWLTITGLLHGTQGQPAANPPKWWPAFTMSMLSFIPVIVTWWKLRPYRLANQTKAKQSEAAP